MSITLDPRLADECLVLQASAHGWILLRDEARFPWCLWVPRSDAVEFHQLEGSLQRLTLSVVARLGQLIAADPDVEKVNVAALGNIVRQQHWHVVGRHENDPQWPGPPFGLPRQPCSPALLTARSDRLRQGLISSADPLTPQP